MDYLLWHFLHIPRRLLAITDNFLQFYTHFFSIPLLLKTFLSPWHKIVTVKTERGFNLGKLADRVLGNIFSSIIGIILRTVVIFIWFMLVIETALLGLIVTILWLLLPLATLPFYLDQKNKPRDKKLHQQKFIKQHSLTAKTKDEAKKWFARFWEKRQQRFWHKQNLLSVPSPTAKWHFGYTPLLDKYAKDLTEKIYLIEDQIIGRNKEIETVTRILSRSTQPALILHGPVGSGRHAVVYELARRIHTDHASLPGGLKSHRVIKIDADRLTKQVLSEAAQAGNIILVLDEIHKLLDYFDLLAPHVQRGKLKAVGLTTTKKYQQFLHKNELAGKLFELVEVKPLPSDYVLRLLENKAVTLEKKRKITFPVESLQRIIELGNQSPGTQPDTSLDLLEEISIKGSSFYKTAITPQMINKLAEEKLKIPLGTLGPQEKRKLANLEKLLHEHVINQDTAITELANALRRARLKLESPNRPLASFLFFGPTGVGKTETAKALARAYSFPLLRFDMSNYQNKPDANRLITELANKTTQQPYGVLLLDEIEKAHSDLLNLFLSIIDEGYFTDLDGDSVSCRNLFIIGTSNARYSTVPGNAPSISTFSPEFINRFDGIITFQPLGKNELVQITRLKLSQLNARLQKEHATSVEITDDLIDKIIEQGYKPEFGARELNRAIQRLVETPLAKKLLEE